MSINEGRRAEIKKEARQILDDFSSALAKVRIKGKKTHREVGGFREEGAGMKGDEDFRRRMFENAPEKNGDFIIAEKKKWPN